MRKKAKNAGASADVLSACQDEGVRICVFHGEYLRFCCGNNVSYLSPQLGKSAFPCY